MRFWERHCTVFLFLIALGVQAAEAESPPKTAERMHHVASMVLSPDGETVVFVWVGDLWMASAKGGEARRLIKHPARESFPKFSPDGKRVVFCSDRNGTQDLFSVNLAGKDLQHHGGHSEGYALEAISPCSTKALVRIRREQADSRQSALAELSLTQPSREKVLINASGHSASWSPDGKALLFCRGGEALYRMGYRGSRAAKLWQLELDTGKTRQLFDEPTEIRAPIWHPDGQGFYYLSARSGTLNLWTHRFEPNRETQLTFFTSDMVLPPSMAADGSCLMFRSGSEAWRLETKPGAEPQKVHFWTRERLPDVAVDRKRVSGTSDVDFTPSLKSVIFSSLGDLYRLEAGSQTPNRLTETPEAESNVTISNDGKWLYFIRDNGIAAECCRAELTKDGIGDLVELTSTGRSKTNLQLSHDGKRMIWLEASHELWTAHGDGSHAKKIHETWNKPHFDLSPDGEWLAASLEDADANRDITLIATQGDSSAIVLNAHPAFDGSPRWSPDGRYLAYTSRRDPTSALQLFCIDWGHDNVLNSRDSTAIKQQAAKAKRLRTLGIEPDRLVWSDDSSRVFYQSKKKHNPHLYATAVDGSGTETVARRRGIPIRMLANHRLLWRVDRTPEVFSLRRKSSDNFPISLRVERARQEVLRLGFRKAWRTLGERFYDPSMNQLDWNEVLERYESDAIHCRDSRQFDRVVTRLLGELNASHLVFLRKTWPPEPPLKKTRLKTMHLGLIFAPPSDRLEAPLTISQVIPGSPVSKVNSPPQVGEKVLSINGKPLNSHSSLLPFLNDPRATFPQLEIQAIDGSRRTIKAGRISYSRARRLVKEASRLAIEQQCESHNLLYLPFEQMDEASLEKLKLTLYAESGRAGLILDVRGNGGGRVADELLAVFTQPNHSFTYPRNGPRGYPHARRLTVAWTKPFVVLCNERTYSNAEIFCHAISHSGIAPLVGNETAGGVISALFASIPDVGRLQIPFRGWFDQTTGLDLDLNGAVPDRRILITPRDEHTQRDPQLEAAIEILRQRIREMPPPATPIYKHRMAVPTR